MASGGAEAKKGLYDEPPILGIPRQHVVSMIVCLDVWLSEGLSPYKWRTVASFCIFSYCILLRVFLLLAFVVFFAYLSTKTRKLFCTGDIVLRHSYAAGDFISRQQPFFFRVPFGTCTFAIGVPFVAFVGSLVLLAGWFGHCSGVL